ncbi:hypothetical protein [Propionivibrio sp.]|uniref:hypothetical protein n=1 Tax=Propionivibrio sp. TaxID=2212460 RepID=UPI003BEFE156
MAKIISYQKHIDAQVTRELRLPEGEGSSRIGTELATIDGTTYVSLPDDAVLPGDQPVEIAASIVTVTLDLGLRVAIANASPQVRLIRHQVAEKIAEEYSTSDEIKLLRTAPSAEFEAYNAFVEDCRAWGRERKVALGLGRTTPLCSPS